MNGNFSEEAMKAFAAMVGEKNFSEGLFDFTTCQRPDGSKYGTSGHCRKGTQTETVARTPSGRRGTPKPLRGQNLANMMKDHLNIENSVRANHGGGLQTKAAKEEFAAALKKAGVPDKATIKAALVAQQDEERAGKA